MGYGRFFVTTGVLSVVAAACLLLVRDADYSHERARGLAPSPHGAASVVGPEVQEGGRCRAQVGDSVSPAADAPAPPAAVCDALCQPSVARLCAACACFHLSNSAMLPEVGAKLSYLYEQSSAEQQAELHVFGAVLPLDGKNGVSLSTLVAQLVMVPVALASGWLARQSWCGSKRALLLGFATLPLRGVGFAYCDSPWGLLALQILDGVGAGCFGVLSVLLMSDLTEGTGRFNLMQGVLVAASGVGASTSNALGGALVDAVGFKSMFLALASISLLALLLLGSVRAPPSAGVRPPLVNADAAIQVEQPQVRAQSTGSGGGTCESELWLPAL